MGIWKSIKRGIKGAGHLLAKPVGFAERAGGTVGGFMVGGPAGAMAGYKLGDKIANVEEDALSGRNVRKNLKSNIVGGITAGAGLYGASGAPGAPVGVKRAMSFAPGGGGGPVGPGGAPTPTFPGGGGGTPSVPGADGGTDWMSIAEGGLAGLSALNSARASQQAGKYGDMAVKHATDRWAEGDPLRVAGRNQMLHPVTPDLTSVYNDPNNAFSRPVSPPGAPQAIRRPMMAPPRRAFR